MPDEEKKPTITTEKIEGIPLYLIPKAIADQIKKKGEAVFQIMVERKFHHRYTVNSRDLRRARRAGKPGGPCPRRRRRAWLTGHFFTDGRQPG